MPSGDDGEHERRPRCRAWSCAGTPVLFALAASALAFSITEPTNSTGWTTSGPNQVSWEKVSTDNNNFTIVLSNQVSI